MRDHPDIEAAERTGYQHKPKVFAYCEECGGEIYVGENYYEIRDMVFCPWCIETMRKEA